MTSASSAVSTTLAASPALSKVALICDLPVNAKS
jgi:hypothetical protein